MWVSLWGRKLQLAHPISHQVSFIFPSISPVTVYDLFKNSLCLLSRASLGKWVDRTQQINERWEGRGRWRGEPAPSLSAQQDSSDKRRHPGTRVTYRCSAKTSENGRQENFATQCFSVSDWIVLEEVWSLKRGVVSTVESTRGRDRQLLTVTVEKPLKKKKKKRKEEDATVSYQVPRPSHRSQDSRNNTQSERCCSHCKLLCSHPNIRFFFVSYIYTEEPASCKRKRNQSGCRLLRKDNVLLLRRWQKRCTRPLF